jgi:hypothetical protein
MVNERCSGETIKLGIIIIIIIIIACNVILTSSSSLFHADSSDDL